MKAINCAILSAAAVLALSCGGQRFHEFRGYAQGGTYCVKADLGGVKVTPARIHRKIESILTEVDTTFSGYNRNSVLSRRNEGADVPTNGMFDDLLRISEHYTDITRGAFNPYAAPLFDIWGFGFRNDSLPSKERIDEAMAATASERTLNFNAIAQGYTCDLVAAYLRSIGVRNYLVDIGEIACSGKNPHGKGWTISIDTPYDGNMTPGESICGKWISDGGTYGVVTSGNYRKYYVKDGKKYAHTIDPRTGRPVEHGLLSATVIAPNATCADAMATYFMVAGFEEASRIISEADSLEGCLVTADSVWTSKGFN